MFVYSRAEFIDDILVSKSTKGLVMTLMLYIMLLLSTILKPTKCSATLIYQMEIFKLC